MRVEAALQDTIGHDPAKPMVLTPYDAGGEQTIQRRPKLPD